MDPSLATTNVFLGIMATVSVLEGLLLIGAAIAGVKLYRRVIAAVAELDRRHVEPAMARMIPLMDDVRDLIVDVKQVSAAVRGETQAMHRRIDRVDETVGRVRSNVKARTSWMVGAIKGARVALEHVLQG